MKTINKEDIRRLHEIKSDRFISIYIPTHKAGEAVNNGKDIIVFKNQIQKLKNDLQDKGMAEPAAKEYLKEGYKLIDNTSFWHNQSDGLVVFIADDFFEFYNVPYAFAESTMISNAFNLKDLMPVLHGDGRYYVLTLSLNKIRFFEATKHTISQINLPEDMPRNLEEGMKYTEVLSNVQKRQGATSGVSNTVYHGQGADDKRDDFVLEDYLRDVAKGIFDVVKEENAPMVLYGTEKIKHLYREANHYNHLLEKSIEGNPDDVKPNEIKNKSWEIVKDLFSKNRDNHIRKYNELAGTGRTSYDITKIVPAAANGRVEALFVAQGNQVWGQFNESDQSVLVKEHKSEGDYCLLNKAATDTFVNGGEVYTLDRENLPEYSVDSPMVAIYRY